MKLSYLVSLLSLCLCSAAFAGQSKISYWDTQRRGANFFNSVELPERFQAGRDFGIQVVRLAPNKWLNGRPESERGDFLIGRPNSDFQYLNQNDLAYLKKVLTWADQAGIKVVLTMLSLPGSRWKDHNNDVEDRRIWQDFRFHEASARFWKQLAAELKDHPAVVGYNIRNEPSPELVQPRFPDWYTGDYGAWYRKIRGTPADLNLFYKKVVAAIREVDRETPIVLDSGFYATPWAFKIMEPALDHKILYSFHMYEPYAYTSYQNQGSYSYPGTIPVGESDNTAHLDWNKSAIVTFLNPVVKWQKQYRIPSNRIFAAEFGVYRYNKGAGDYLKDVIESFETHRWHWAFYAFREDSWDGMDYELGDQKPGEKYWDAVQNGVMPGPDVYKDNPISEVVKKALTEVDDGKIIQVWEPDAGGGCNKKFSDTAHNIKILHGDGTVAQYVHVQSKLKIGEMVKQGQAIAQTANNGFHCVPQLHFSIFRDRNHIPESRAPKTVPLLFRDLPDGGIAREGYEGAAVDVGRKVPTLPEDIKQVFMPYEGCFLAKNLSTGEVVEFNGPQCRVKYQPCSTFKILNALIGLETGILRESTVIKWDGKRQPVKEWERDHDLAPAIRFSVVPYFQEVARRIGLTRMQNYVSKIGYGNQQIGSVIDRFWLDGPLAINAYEQLGFIERLYEDRLPFSKANMSLVRKLLVQENESGRVFSGKTGSAFNNGAFEWGWFIGDLKRSGGDEFVFAASIAGTGAKGYTAQKIANQIFEEMGL